MKGLRPYLTFPGTCKEAMAYYADCLGGKVTSSMPFSSAPMDLPPGSDDLIMHSELELPMGWIYASDGMPNDAPVQGNAMSISLSFDDVETAQAAFQKMSSEGQTTMPFEKTFWGETFGMLTDKYGVQWMFSAPGGEE